MDSFFTRYRSEVVLAAVLFVQLIALATQVRVPAQIPAGTQMMTGRAATAVPQQGGTRLIRVWATAIVTPFQKLTVNGGAGFRSLWTNYIDLRHVRSENEELRRQISDMRLQQIRMQQDAEQGKRLQALLGFRESYA